MKLLKCRFWPIFHVGILALAYFLTGKLAATMLGLVKAEASPVWPPAGIALAALAIQGRWMWPGVALGSLLLNCSAGASIPLAVIATSAANATLQALVGETLLRRLRFSPRLERLRDVLGLLVGAAMLSTLVGSSIGNLSACLFGWAPWSSFWRNWWTMWLGDGMGILVVAPLLFTSSSLLKNCKLSLQKNQSLRFNFSFWVANSSEVAIWLSLLVGVSWLVFSSKTSDTSALYPLEYLPFPLVMWAALRFGQRGAVLASVIVSSIAILGAIQGGGPFLVKTQNLSQAVLFLQAFMGVMAITSLVLAAAVAERQQALVEMRRVASLLWESEASLANAQRIAHLGNWDLKYTLEEAETEEGQNCQREWQNVGFVGHPSLQSKIQSLKFKIELRWSDELYRLLGFAPGSVEPGEEAFLQAVHPDDRELVKRSHARATLEQKPYCIDYRIILPDGQERVVQEQSAIRLGSVMAAVQDITERKRAEEALRMSVLRERLLGEIALRIRRSLDLDEILNTTVAEVRQFLKADRAFIALLDTEDLSQESLTCGKVVAESVAPNYRSILGWRVTNETHLRELKEFYAHHRLRVVTDIEQEDVSCPIAQYYQDYYRDYQVRATLNVPIMLSEQFFGLLAVNQCSGPRHWQEFEIDLLEKLATQVAIALQQAQLLHQVKALNTNLERQVEERTHQLQQKMYELEESNRLKDLFLHAVSHNLRTPVMGMLILLKNLLNKPSACKEGDCPSTIPVSRSILERMVQGSEHQLSMVNSLLDAHTSEVNGIELNCVPLKLQELSTEIIAQLEPLLAKNQASLTEDVAPNLPLVNADPKQLRRVFENLLTNALKHNPPGVKLALKIEIVEGIHRDENSSVFHSNYPLEKQMIRCIIQDNGVGINPQQRTSLFKLYVQDPNNRQLTGLGLGLYLSRQIIKAHGGEMGVDSTPGAGSTFWFTLPAVNSSLKYEI